jgi:hypothetical protein
MEVLRKEFQTIGLTGIVSIGLLDPRNILIQPALEEDFIRHWLKGVWYLFGFSM